VLLLVLAATTGPVGLLAGSGRVLVFHIPRYHSRVQPPQNNESLRHVTRHVPQTLDLSWLGTLVAWVIVITVCLAGFLAARYVWRNRWRAQAKPVEVDFDVLPEEAVAEALREDEAGQLTAVAQGTPRDGIVRCWLRLEEAIAGAGLPPRRAETSAEFTVRVLRALDIDPRAIGTLAQLYREARFSEHELDETARVTARSALEQLHRDLRQLGVAGVAP
jgi:hypothetical protein